MDDHGTTQTDRVEAAADKAATLSARLIEHELGQVNPVAGGNAKTCIGAILVPSKIPICPRERTEATVSVS
jgi:hypothetical protein